MLNAAIVGLGRWGRDFVEPVQTKSERIRFACDVDSELEVFARAIEDGMPFPVSAEEMIATVGAFEAVVKALESGETVELP